MCFIKFLLVFFLSLNLSFFNYSLSQENSPASPSSSYSNKYYNEEEIIEPKKKPIPRQTNIIVQGNTRLDASVVIRDSLIDIRKTDPKDLSYAIKNLYKTGYFENVNIFKRDNVIYINVIENPLIDQISIEGNNEISDEIIIAELQSKSRSVYSTDIIKNDVKKNTNDIQKRWLFFNFRRAKVYSIRSE